eukprot:CAMPEP_0113307292 /NCGR_PEP_ID=MMETSP0010_2-20120614/6199_1 /TAXON_ID=216773 ORGANISM="Corethron hystrix, Strain 308" /NCGR_SAMPLE_ID=MMETSP0010_2 /ASSEMBLY_ACC=CAM_ASM_000155 /LENGTH=66 /DNA_ID=CAMNT_0000162125 /DNA_START=12 /DNA_END=209 /DNA_ORIENTATION=- /assembly_acc=CAM_ASM_000155
MTSGAATEEEEDAEDDESSAATSVTEENAATGAGPIAMSGLTGLFMTPGLKAKLGKMGEEEKTNGR